MKHLAVVGQFAPKLESLIYERWYPIDTIQLTRTLTQLSNLHYLTLSVSSLEELPDVSKCQLNQFIVKLDCREVLTPDELLSLQQNPPSMYNVAAIRTSALTGIESVPVTELELISYCHRHRELHRLKGHPTLRRLRFSKIRGPNYDVRITQAAKMKIIQQYEIQTMLDFRPIHWDPFWVEYEKISGRTVEQLYWKLMP